MKKQPPAEPSKKDPIRALDAEAHSILHSLLKNHRQAVLATLDAEGRPYTAMVSYALWDPGRDNSDPSTGSAASPVRAPKFLIHLSELSAHKRHLRANTQCSLMIFEPDQGQKEILMVSRAGFQCRASFVAKPVKGDDQSGNKAIQLAEEGAASPQDLAPPEIQYQAAKDAYLAKFPGHAMMFTLGDFDLVALEANSGLLNAGFGRAYRIL